MRFRSSRPASKYSSRTARSRTRFISSRRRPKVIRPITRSTPGIDSDATICLLLQELSLAKCHHHFVFCRSLRLRVPELPLEASLRIVELRDVRDHALQINTHELPASLPQLEHQAHWQMLPCCLIESRCRIIVLAEEFESEQNL